VYIVGYQGRENAVTKWTVIHFEGIDGHPGIRLPMIDAFKGRRDIYRRDQKKKEPHQKPSENLAKVSLAKKQSA
jgi:hypothetical protein